MAAGSFVSYLRVSTAKQGQSGLGLRRSVRPWPTSLTGGVGR